MQQNSSTGRLVRSKLKLAGHMVRMDIAHKNQISFDKKDVQ